MIEYLPWYQSGATLVRCQKCAALLVSGDTELHTEWHEGIQMTAQAVEIIAGLTLAELGI